MIEREYGMNAFKEKLRSGKKLVGFEIDLSEPCIAEIVGQLGYDYLWIDTEHEAMDYETVLLQIIAARAAGTASLVRVPWNEPYLAKRVLEMGPDGIIFPEINSAEELKKAMDACLYPPYGKRGFGPRRACRYGLLEDSEYVLGANDSFCRFAQIESIEAVNDLDEMLKVPFVDGFILGPCDLSGSIGHLCDLRHPDNLRLVDTVIEKCTKANMPVGIAVGGNTEENIRFWCSRGVQFISAGSDIVAIMSAAREQYKVMRRVFETL